MSEKKEQREIDKMVRGKETVSEEEERKVPGWREGERGRAPERRRKVGLITIRPSLSLQAQMTPDLQPSASHTTNHLVLITGIFSPFAPPPPFSPSLHALLCALAFAKVRLILF